MNETQAEVLAMIETVAKNRGENVAIFMDWNYGNYWTDRYYRAAPDGPNHISIRCCISGRLALQHRSFSSG